MFFPYKGIFFPCRGNKLWNKSNKEGKKGLLEPRMAYVLCAT
jgi:hypothetical protein